MVIDKFIKTGEGYIINEYGEKEWDGDEGFDVEIEVDDNEVKDVLINLVLTNYIEVNKLTISLGEMNATKQILKDILDDYDTLFEEMYEEFKDDLKDYFSDKFNELN